MEKYNYSLPHPVMGVDDDFKEDKGIVKISLTVTSSSELISLTVTPTCTNKYLKNLWKKGDITLTLKIYCKSTMLCKIFSLTKEEEEKIDIKESNVANDLDVECFLVAQKEISDYSDSSFHGDYFLEKKVRVFKVAKYSKIAILNKFKVELKTSNLTRSNSELFNFVDDINESILKFDAEDPRFIQVRIPKEEGENKQALSTVFPTLGKHTFFNTIIIPAIAEGYRTMKEKEKENEISSWIDNSEWAEFLDKKYEDWREDSPFICAQRCFEELMKEAGELKEASSIHEVYEELKRLKN